MNLNLTLIAQAIAFAIFIWFTVKFVWPYLLRAIEARQKQIAEGLAAAERGRAELAEAGKKVEVSLADARNRAQTLANETRDKLNAEAETRRKGLESQLNAKLAEAEKTIAATKSAAMSNVHGIAVDTASAIVQRLIGTAPAGGAVETAVAAALKR